MDKITSDVRRQQWLDIIQACNASGLTKRPGVNIIVSTVMPRNVLHNILRMTVSDRKEPLALAVRRFYYNLI